MDKLKAILETMTFWNWLTLIVFLFFPLSALNAFFGLRSKYKGWKITKSKQKLPGRLRVLVDELESAGEYHDDPHDFYLNVLRDVAHIIQSIIVALMFFIGASGVSLTPLFFLTYPLILATLVFLLVAMRDLGELIALSNRVRFPQDFADEIIA